MAGKMPTTIGGYQIQKKLGEGAFGRVYQAYDANVNRLVAIKVLLLTDKEVVTRFKNEAIVAGNLRHNNIVTIYEFGEHDGLPFLAMEFLDGENLQEVLRSKKPLTMLQKISIMTQIAEGLDCAHRHGVVHRDVKPANMMLLPDGTVKIMDFGIARLTGGQESSRLTQQGNVLGTLLYMAPEQFTPNSEVDALCDIFACGEVFYELLAGKHPFDANEPRVLLYKVTCEDPPPLRNFVPDCPPALEQVLARMLSKPRDLRYHSLREVLFDIQPVLIDLEQERAATLMAEAQELFQKQDAEAANALLPEILKLDPGNRTAYRLREQIQRALLKPKVELFLKTGREELAKRRYYEAIQALDAAARLDITNTEIRDLLAQAKAAQEQSQKASQLVTEARQAFDQKNLTGAYKSASEALMFDPDNPQASRLMLVIQSAIDRKRQEQQLDESLLKAEHLLMIQAYDRALEALAGLDAGDERVAQMAARIQQQQIDQERNARLHTGMTAATEMLREQRLDEAVKRLTALFVEFPDKQDLRQLLEYARKELAAQQRTQAIERIKTDAQALADAHDFRGALAVLDKGLQQYDDGSLVRVLARVMSAKVAWEREEALRAARAKCERLRGEGKLPEAIQAAESALRSHNGDPAITALLRELEHDWEEQKRAEEIRATLTQARKLLDAGQAEKVVRLLGEIEQRFPNSPEIQAMLAQAQTAFQEQERLREVDTVTRDARAHADRASYDAALQAIERGLNKYPDEAGLLALREEVQQKKAALVRRQEVQRAVQDANRMAAEGHFVEALELVAAMLLRYQGEAALLQVQSRLQADWERRQRELAVVEAGNQARALLEQEKPADAVEILHAALEKNPGDRSLESMLARAQRAVALEQFVAEVRTLIDRREFEAALKQLDQGSRNWPGERSLTAMQQAASAGLAAVRRAQAIRDAAARCRLLVSQGRAADALRLADNSLRDYPGEADLLGARQEAQSALDEAERIRKRTADLDALGKLENDARALTDAKQIRELVNKVQSLARLHQGDAEVESSASRTLAALGAMDECNALLTGRDFNGLHEACARLRTQYPAHTFFQRLEAEATRGVRQVALQDVLRRVQAEQDLHGKAQLLDEALQLYPDEPWLQQESRVVRGKLGLVSSIVEKARAAAQAERWDEAIEQWTSLRGLYANYPGLDDELQSLAVRKDQERAEARQRSLDSIRGQVQAGDHEAAAQALQRSMREYPGDPEFQPLREQVDHVHRSVQDARAAAGKYAFEQAGKILETALGRYAGDALLDRELQSVKRQAAERETGIADAVRQGQELAAQQRLEEAWKATEAALSQHGEDSRLVDLRRRLQTLRTQAEQIQQAIRQARALEADEKFAQAAKGIEAELARFPGDAALENELEVIREGIERLEARRVQTIRETAQQIHDLLANNRLDDARKLAETAQQRFPDEPALTEASRQVQSAIAEAERQRKRASELQGLRRVEDEVRALTSSSQIGALQQKLRAIASRYADDAEFAQTAAPIEHQLETMQQAGVLLAQREYAKVLEICARYPDHRLMQGLKTEAERGDRAARVAEAQRQIEAETDLRRRSALLETTLRSFPNEAALVDRSRALQRRLDQAESTAEKARQAGKAARWEEAIALWNSVREMYPEYPGMEQEVAGIEDRREQARLAERQRLGGEILQHLNAGDYDKAGTLLPHAQQHFPDDAELQAWNIQMQAARDTVRQARTLAGQLNLSQAAELIESAQKLYPQDKLLERELQSVRQEQARQVELRAEAIRQATQSVESLVAQGRPEEALKLAAKSLRQYPGETSLLAAQERAQAALEEAQRALKRNNDLQSLRKLEAEARALTDAARAAGLRAKVEALAAAYTGDEEISHAAADLDRQLAAMGAATEALNKGDFAAARALCASYSGHPIFARIDAAAERGERNARVAEVERKVEEESDLMRQIELLDATMRFYPDEASLLQRSRVVRGKLDQVDALVQKARQAEKAESWDEALAQWAAAGELYKDYPGLAQEIERVTGLKERAHAARREKVGDEIWQKVNAGDYAAAAALLDRAQQEFPGDGELQFLREQVDSVRKSVADAHALAAKGEFNDAVRVLEAALERNAGDALLERELGQLRQQAGRRAALEQVLASAEQSRAEQKFDEALQSLNTFTSQYGVQPAVAQLSLAILQEQQTARHQAQVHDALLQVRKLAREGKHDAIVQLVRESPAHVQQDAEIREVVAAAGQILEEQRQHQAAIELVAQARALTQQTKFAEALQLLDRNARQYPHAAATIASARAEIALAQAAWRQTRDAEQTSQLAAAKEAQRIHEQQILEDEVEKLVAKKKYAAALRKIDESGDSSPEIVALRQRVQALTAAPRTPPPVVVREEPLDEPRPKSKLGLIAAGVAILALAGWGVSTLLHRGGTLIVETAPAAVVSVDGAAGTPADDKGTVELHVSAGKHTVAVSKPGFDNAEQSVEVKSGENRLTVNLNPSGRNQLTATPVIASLDPGSVVNLDAAFTLTVTGSGFQSGTVVKWNGSALRTTRAKSTQLRAAVPASLVGTPGKAVVTVVNPGNVNSEPVTLPINPSAPAIAGLQPDAVNAGDAGFVLRVNGSGFQPGATVQWNNVKLSTTVEGAQTIRAAVPAKLIANPGHASVVVVNPGDASSSAVTFTINSLTPTPAISGLNPPSATAGGPAFALTVSGSNFVQGASVHWNGSSLSGTVTGGTQLRVNVPANLIANAGNARLSVMNPGNVSSPEVNLSITAPTPAPAISGLSPGSGTVGTAVNLTVNGSNFQSGASVEWNRSAIPATFVSATQLKVPVPANLLASPGSASVVVTNPTGTTSAPATFTINPPAAAPPPVITGLNPSSAAAGGSALNMSVVGSGFVQGAVVHWNRSVLATNFASANQLRAAVPADLISGAGTANVTVVNPDNTVSGAASFTINPPAVVPPTIGGLNPPGTAAGGPAFTLTINGSGFQQNSTVQWNHNPVPTHFGGAGQLTANISPNLIAAPGSVAITVVNSGNVSTGAATFTIGPAQIARPDPEIETVKSVLTQYADAFTRKDFNKLIALFPGLPKGERSDLQNAFKNSEYKVQVNIEVTAPPVIRGDDATVNARIVTASTFGKRVSAPVTRTVVFSLHRGGGQWTITGLR